MVEWLWSHRARPSTRHHKRKTVRATLFRSLCTRCRQSLHWVAPIPGVLSCLLTTNNRVIYVDITTAHALRRKTRHDTPNGLYIGDVLTSEGY